MFWSSLLSQDRGLTESFFVYFSQICPIILRLMASTQAKITWSEKLTFLCPQFLASVLTFMHASICSFIQNIFIECVEPGMLEGKTDLFIHSDSFPSRLMRSLWHNMPHQFYLQCGLSSGLKSVHFAACLMHSYGCFTDSLNSICLKWNWFSSGLSLPGGPIIVPQTAIRYL